MLPKYHAIFLRGEVGVATRKAMIPNLIISRMASSYCPNCSAQISRRRVLAWWGARIREAFKNMLSLLGDGRHGRTYVGWGFYLEKIPGVDTWQEVENRRKQRKELVFHCPHCEKELLVEIGPVVWRLAALVCLFLASLFLLSDILERFQPPELD
jgi:hypothetical protein